MDDHKILPGHDQEAIRIELLKRSLQERKRGRNAYFNDRKSPGKQREDAKRKRKRNKARGVARKNKRRG